MPGILSRRSWIGPALGLAASLVALPLLQSSLFQGFEKRTVDARMQLRGTAEAAPEIVVCAIDGPSVDRLGQWPWPRSVLAQLIDRIHEAGARTIAIDIVFSEPSRLGVAEDEALAAAIERAGDVVLGFFLTNQPRLSGAGTPEEQVLPLPVELAVTPPDGFPAVPSFSEIEANIPLLTRAAPAAGHFVIQPDSDGTVRHYPLILEHDGVYYPSLALRAAQVFLGSPPISVRPYQGRLPLIELGDLVIPASEAGELWINYRGPFGETFDYVSAASVLDGKISPDRLRDRLVIIGATETGIGDFKTSAFDVTVPGVEMHATVADNLLHRRFVRDGAPEVMLSVVAILLLGPIGGALAVRFRKPARGALLSLAALLGYTTLSQLALTEFNRHLHLFLPVLAGAMGYTIAVIWRTVFAERKARQIRRTFSHYVSEAVVETMLENPERVHLGGEKRDLTVLFSDIRGFTTLSEKLSPDEVVKLLNAYLTPMTRIILDEGGTLDKYMGDAIMAFFGAPVDMDDHARRACTAALAMKSCMRDLELDWQRRGLPTLTSGIGLNTGAMSVGNMGSDMIFDYTVIGDHVNLGSRLEGLTRLYGVEIVTSEFTVARAGAAFGFRELDQVRVKGKTSAVRVFELVGRRDEIASLERFHEVFGSGLEAYRAADFDRAEALFRKGAVLRADDVATALYLDRIAELKAAPPADDWDGITNLTTK